MASATKIIYVHKNPLVAKDTRFEFWNYGYNHITAGPTAEHAISQTGGKGFTLAEIGHTTMRSTSNKHQ